MAAHLSQVGTGRPSWRQAGTGGGMAQLVKQVQIEDDGRAINIVNYLLKVCLRLIIICLSVEGILWHNKMNLLSDVEYLQINCLTNCFNLHIID